MDGLLKFGLLVCVVALLATPVVAGVQSTVVAPVVVQAAPCPQVVVQTAPVVVQTIEVQQACVTVQTVAVQSCATAYTLGSRRLRLGERIRSNIDNRKANRVARVAILEPVATVAIAAAPSCLGMED